MHFQHYMISRFSCKTEDVESFIVVIAAAAVIANTYVVPTICQTVC